MRPLFLKCTIHECMRMNNVLSLYGQHQALDLSKNDLFVLSFII